MIKKYIAVCMCVLAVCAVLGLNARLEYDDIQTAFDSVDSSANVLWDDVSKVQMIAFVVENFAPNDIFEVHYSPWLVNGEQMYRVFITRRTFDEANSNWFVSARLEVDYYSEDEAKATTNMLKPLTWTTTTYTNILPNNGILGAWDNVITAVGVVVFILGLIVSILALLVWIVFDAVGIAWSIVMMGLYILGFPIRLPVTVLL